MGIFYAEPSRHLDNPRSVGCVALKTEEQIDFDQRPNYDVDDVLGAARGLSFCVTPGSAATLEQDIRDMVDTISTDSYAAGLAVGQRSVRRAA